MADVFFLHRIKHDKTNGTWDKGIEIKESKPTREGNYDDALQSYHAYLGAYAYGHDASTDYVACYITDEVGNRPLWETWFETVEPQVSEE